MQNLLHVHDNRFDSDHDRLLDPRVVIRIIQAELKLICEEGEITIGLPVVFIAVELVSCWLFLSDDLAEETDDAEDRVA